ncbi:MAG: ABZJ_00895 family protein [Pseudomonadota bacterium]
MFFRSRVFIWNYLFALTATLAFCGGLVYVPGLKPGLSAPLVLPLLIAAMIEGRAFAQEFLRRPEPQRCWIAAFNMAVLLGFTVALPAWIATLVTLDAQVFALPYLLAVLVVVPTLRAGYEIGLAIEMKPLRDDVF